jgi:hypothetical protein
MDYIILLIDMLLDYLAPTRARREVWKALRAPGPELTVRGLALRAGLPYSNAHREVLRMREAGLLTTRAVGGSLLCSWNTRNPATRTLTALLDASERGPAERPADDAVYGSLKSWGAGLAKGAPSSGSLPLEETLAYGVDLARRDPDVAETWPVVLAKNRARLDLGRLESLARRLGQKRALGFLLSLTGQFLGDPSLAAYARRLRDARVRASQDFFTGSAGKRTRALTEANTPRLARAWHFRMNTSLDSLRHHFDKFAGRG